MKFALFPNLSKPAAFRTAAQTCEILHAQGAEVFMAPEDASAFSGISTAKNEDDLLRDSDFVIAVGGDGTILRAAGKILAHAKAFGTDPIRLVGINTGTLGFLAAFEADELFMLERLFSGDYGISERMLLSAEIGSGKHRGQTLSALNDVYASRLNGRICDFAVYVDERQIGVYRADGIVFSTPTGSTAYALSAGGPVMEPDLSLIEMNLVCPHSLFARPMLFSPQRSIRVCYEGAGTGGLRVHADGCEAAVIQSHQSFSVTADPQTMPFVDCKGHGFYDALNGKLMQPLKQITVRP